MFFQKGKFLFRFLFTSKQCRCGKRHFDVIFNGLVPSIMCRKMRNTPLMKEELGGKVFNSSLSRHFRFAFFEVIFLFLYLDLACKQLFFLPRKRPNMRNESSKTQQICAYAFHQTLKINNPLLAIKPSCFILVSDVASKIKFNSVSKAAQLVFMLMATLRNEESRGTQQRKTR